MQKNETDKNFWVKVQEEYEKYADSNFQKINICNASPDFHRIWNQENSINQAKIQYFGLEFLNQYNKPHIKIGFTLLFIRCKDLEECVQVRKNFLKYMVNEKQEILD